MNELSNKVNEINELHKLAITSANEAVNYAKQIGQLLLEAKAELPHGKFLNWLKDNIEVSQRQAQRYMQAASGKDLRLSDFNPKNDMMSVLSTDQLFEKCQNPKWVPKIGHWYTAHFNLSGYWVVPSKSDENYFHITRFYSLEDIIDREDDDWETFFSGTRWPVHYLSVDRQLYNFGISYPERLKWHSHKDEGLDRPFGEPESARENRNEKSAEKKSSSDEESSNV
jgi:hypothetical protein